MKTLLLMRHAKSSWKDNDIKDFDRPLNKRGEIDAPLMGKLLHEQELVPQRILSSPALRARMTAEAIVKEMDYSGEVEYFDSFYLAEPSVYFDMVRTLPDAIERVLLIGHNPGLEAVLQVLTKQVVPLPTAALAHIALPLHQWSDLNLEVDGELVQLWRPRDLKKQAKEKHEDE